MKRSLKHGTDDRHLHVKRPAWQAWRQGLCLVAAVGLLGAAAGAQTTTQASPQTQTQSPFWGGGAGQAYPGARPDHHGGYDRDDFDDEFPVDLVGEVAPAHAAYTATRWGYRTSQSAVWQRVTALRQDFETSEEYRSLQREIQEALAALEQARQRTYAPLQDDPEYVAAGQLYESLERQIDEAHRRQDVDPAEIAAMSKQAMEYAQRQRDIELALAADERPIEEARQRLEELGQRQRDLESEFKRSVRDDEQLRQMRDQANQLKIAQFATGAYYESAVRAANLAADFAYTRQYLRSPWYGQAGYVSPYGYGGYGFGYGYGGFVPNGLIIAGPGLGGLGPTEVKLGNPFPRLVGPGISFVGPGAQVNSAPTIPPDAFE